MRLARALLSEGRGQCSQVRKERKSEEVRQACGKRERGRKGHSEAFTGGLLRHAGRGGRCGRKLPAP